MAGQASDAHKLAAVFPSPNLCEMLTAVKLLLVLRRLLSILAIVGLVVAPLVTPASAGGMTAAGVAAMADMPCCPDESAPVDCGQCPLMALCVSTTLQSPLPAGIAEIQPVALRMLLPGSDSEVESVAYSPPPKPPRSLVRSA